MRAARLLPLLAVAAATLAAGSAGASPLAGPTGLHGFLLRADEPQQTSFSRTPSFAWDPTPGATGYEFQLSTSNTFATGDNSADNGIFYDTNSLTSPVIAPPLVLPWITGTPHSLYARVRATTPNGVTAWSADYGFDIQPDPAYPTALPTSGDAGLLRWTPIEGADAYDVWLVDLPNGGKVVTTRTNVLDEREFYTFHGSQDWIGSIRWRVRAVRSTEAGTPANKFPVTSHTGWSPIYRSTNPPLTPGPLQLVHSISDVVESGVNPHNDPAHKLMPAFTWRGNQVQLPNGTTASAELFRVEIFSDKSCLNLAYAGPIVGGQSWAARPGGSMQLTGDRSSFPTDGQQGISSMYDGTPIQSNEDLSPASPTTTAPPDAIPAGASQAVTSPGPSATFPPITGTPRAGAPVDLWDTYWPDTGYYWTVMPVAPALGSANATVAAPGGSKGSTLVPVSDSSQFAKGETVTIGLAPNSDTVTVTAVGNGLLTVSAPLNFGHVAGDPIVVLGSSGGLYKDLLLPQDLCSQPSLVHQVGIWSEPVVTSPQAPFVTGLSATGRLVSATKTSQFYGQPLVAWTPALRAEKYEIEWSSSNAPFVSEGNILTSATAAVLPLTAGTWYYRVRGFDYNLPTGAQQMAWSTTEKLVISKPVFKVVYRGSAPKTKAKPASAASGTRRLAGDGFSLSLPSRWAKVSLKDTALTFMYRDPVTHGGLHATLTVLKSSGRGTRSLDGWKADLAAEFKQTTGAAPTASVVTLPAGKAVRLDATGAGKQPLRVVEYVIDAGPIAYVVATGSGASSYAGYAATFAKALASFRVG